MGFFTKKEVTEKRDMTIENSGIGADIMYAKLYGGTVDAELAMQIPSVARSVNMIASAVAMLPVKMYRKNGAEVEEITDDPRIRMLNSVTGDTISADEMRFSMVRDFLLKGSAYAFIGREYGKPEKLYYIPEKYVCVMKNEADIIHKRFNYSIQGKPYYPYQLLKVLKGTDGFGRGKGIVQENPMILDTAYQMMKFQKNQLIKGGNKKGFLKAEKALGQRAIDEVKSAWARLYSNENTESMVFLNEGIDFKEVSSTSVEMQINQNMTAANAELMKLFGTSDGILSDDTVKNAVMPVIDAFEAAYDNDLLLESERVAVYFAFDTRELTRGNIQQRYSAYATALQQNFLQLDEVRAMEDLPPLGVNFIRLGLQDVLLDPKTGKIYTPNTNAMVDMGSGAGSQEIEVDKEQKSGIIDVRGNPNHDPNTGRFTFGRAKMSPKEHKRLSSQFGTDFPNAEKDRIYPYENRNHFYLVKVHGFGSYSFLTKIPLKGNTEKINRIRKGKIDE